MSPLTPCITFLYLSFAFKKAFGPYHPDPRGTEPRNAADIQRISWLLCANKIKLVAVFYAHFSPFSYSSNVWYTFNRHDGDTLCQLLENQKKQTTRSYPSISNQPQPPSRSQHFPFCFQRLQPRSLHGVHLRSHCRKNNTTFQCSVMSILCHRVTYSLKQKIGSPPQHRPRPQPAAVCLGHVHSHHNEAPTKKKTSPLAN